MNNYYDKGKEQNRIGQDFSSTRFKFLLNRKYFFGDKLLPVIQHGFLRSAENVYIHNFLVLFGKKIFPIILFGGIIGRCYSLLWQMLMPLYKIVVIF